jgi:hypothetical protein
MNRIQVQISWEIQRRDMDERPCTATFTRTFESDTTTLLDIMAWCKSEAWWWSERYDEQPPIHSYEITLREIG